MRWHEMSGDAVVETLQISRRGHWAGEPRHHLGESGPNVLVEGKRSPLGMFLDETF